MLVYGYLYPGIPKKQGTPYIGVLIYIYIRIPLCRDTPILECLYIGLFLHGTVVPVYKGLYRAILYTGGVLHRGTLVQGFSAVEGEYFHSDFPPTAQYSIVQYSIVQYSIVYTA